MNCIIRRGNFYRYSFSFEKKIGYFSSLYFLALSIIFFIPSMAPCLTRCRFTIGSIFLGTSGLLFLVFCLHKKKDLAEKALVKIDFSKMKKQEFFKTSTMVIHIFSFLTVKEGVRVCNTCREGAFFLRVNVAVHKIILQPVLVNDPSPETIVLIRKIQREGIRVRIETNSRLDSEKMLKLEKKRNELMGSMEETRQELSALTTGFEETRQMVAKTDKIFEETRLVAEETEKSFEMTRFIVTEGSKSFEEFERYFQSIGIKLESLQQRVETLKRKQRGGK